MNKIKIKSKLTNSFIWVEEVGNYILYDSIGGRIYLRQSNTLLVNATFTPQFGRVLAWTIHHRYGDRLSYLGWENWLSGLHQIHNAEKESFIFNDFLIKLEKHIGIINETVAKEAMEWAREQAQ